QNIDINDFSAFQPGDVVFFHYGNPDRPRHTGVISRKGDKGWLDVENISVGSFSPCVNRVVECGITSGGKKMHSVLRVPDSATPGQVSPVPQPSPQPVPQPQPQPQPDIDPEEDQDWDPETDPDWDNDWENDQRSDVLENLQPCLNENDAL
ncbi:MAG: hypothetical protein PHQ23_03230, partial [Candidatus Wallbacteria bacterium]|nr:hypothetical protein [Candidatus Wallbacteria bacterium]